MQSLDWPVLGSISAVYMVGLVSPGPNLLMVSRASMRHGVSHGLATAAGVVVVNALWCSASLFGLGVLLATMPAAAGALRLLGAVYLAWLALVLWRGAGVPVEAAEVSPGNAFRTGLATNLGNVKAIVFYASVLSASAPAGTTPITLAAALVVVVVASATFYGGVVLALSRPRAVAAYLRAKPLIDRLCGVAMLGFAILLAVGR